MTSITELKSFQKDLIKVKNYSNFSFSTYEKQREYFLDNVNHPSLEFKHITCKLYKHRYSFRIDKNYRVLVNKLDIDLYEFVRIVNHKDYDYLVKPQNC